LVQNKDNTILGTMMNLAHGNYSFRQNFATSVTASVNIISILVGKCGQEFHGLPPLVTGPFVNSNGLGALSLGLCAGFGVLLAVSLAAAMCSIDRGKGKC